MVSVKVFQFPRQLVVAERPSGLRTKTVLIMSEPASTCLVREIFFGGSHVRAGKDRGVYNS